MTGERIFFEHDHHACAADAMARAETLIDARKLRMTPVRRRVLEILLEDHRAMGAYEVLERLAEEGFGKQPPVAYRALDFLVEAGLAHRVQRLNAFAACQHADENHAPAFLICRECRSIAEADAGPARDALTEVAAQSGFHVERTTIEALGLCPACVDQAA